MYDLDFGYVIGSSPPAWGTFHCQQIHSGRVRFIPTCVRNIARYAARCLLYSVHPTCVGNISSTTSTSTAFPVHPHLRGEHILHHAVTNIFLRFIPTCVGNISGLRRVGLQQAVHPHLRGEHTSLKPQAATLRGSSPPAWGTFSVKLLYCWHFRFIPTCVGNMLAKKPHGLPKTVHPHLRGEHPTPSASVRWFHGSSPPAWGTSYSDRIDL